MLRPNEDEIRTVELEKEMRERTATTFPVMDSTQSKQKPNKHIPIPFDVGSKIKVIPEVRKGQLNIAYLSTISGVLKIAEIFASFVAFILSICADRDAASTGWTEHLAFESMVVISALLLGYVAFPHITLGEKRTRDGLIVLELLFYGVNTFFFFIAVWLMVHLAASFTAHGRGAAIMSAVTYR